MKKRHRVFVAINFSPDVKDFLFSHSKKWPELPAKWTNLDNIHITLVFLGNLDDSEIGQVCMAVKEVAKQHNTFTLNFNKISYGPIGKIPPRMVWAGVEKSRELSSLKNDLEEFLLEKINLKKDTKKFSPHITLARINSFEWRVIEPEERPEVNENIDLRLSVESIEVMESVLKKTGPEYSVIESFSLVDIS